MNESLIYNSLLIAWFIIGAIVFIALFFIVAPYGRHARKGWGYSVGNKLGWVLMEAPAPIVFAVCFLFGETRNSPVTLVFLAMWEMHYLHRAFIYPFSLRGVAKRMPLGVVAMGFFFNIMNGYLNGRYILGFSGGYDNSWLADPRFIVGVLLFITGYVINRQADQALRDLRKPGESGYKISYSRFHRWVSSPNYLGEITIWVGWALATWSLPGLAFAFWTVANLIPRARANHAWYRRTFADYPAERKALLPKIW
ncbi:MAG: 3-oxo-5-alpha-steroid 4-dehydrogenase [Chloroflexi bacterium RBG_13_51_52]|nr:MAG: 3-oxo-5-alpha-steroid 4-dehydrogenase [Chloroflexi bacterium RBG_13_51_52]